MNKAQLFFKVVTRTQISFDISIEEIRKFPFPSLYHFEYSFVIVGFDYIKTDQVNIEEFKAFASVKLKEQYKAYSVEFIDLKIIN